MTEVTERRWYVVHTHPRTEHKAAWHLRNQGFEVYLPRYLKRRRHARKVELVPTPLFPRYLFVAMDVARERWRAIRSSIGVANLVCQGDMPAPAPAGVVEGIQAREGDDGLVVLRDTCAFAKGALVRIVEGALEGLTGLFDCVSDDDRVVVLLELLGREVRVRVPLETVRASA